MQAHIDSTPPFYAPGVQIMIFSQTDRKTLAQLLKTHSVKTGNFLLASGQTSPVYIDVKKTSLTGHGAHLIGRALWQLARKIAPDTTAAGGLTLGADPLLTAMSIAAYQNQSDFAAILVRKRPKKHGTMQFLEMPDQLQPGQSVLAVDDVVTTAGSTLEAIGRLRDAGFVIHHALCVVDRQAGATEALQAASVQLHSLFLLEDLL